MISLSKPPQNRRVYDLAFSPRQTPSVCAFALEQTVQFWDLSAEPRLLATLETPPAGHSRAVEREHGRPLAFSGDGARLATARFDLGIQVWNLDERKLAGGGRPGSWMPEAIRFIAADQGLAVGYSWRGLLSIAGRFPSKVRILARAERGRQPPGDRESLETYKDAFVHGGALAGPQEEVHDAYCVAVSPDGRKLFYGGGPVFTEIDDSRLWTTQSVTAWDMTTARRMFTIGGEQAPVLRFCLSPSGSTLYSCGAAVLAWDATKPEPPIRKFDVPGRLTISVAVSADSTMLAAGDREGTVVIWDAGSTARVATLTHGGGPVYCLAFSPTSTKLVAAGERGIATVWDIKSTPTKQN
jgi:WD40 repeat protein